MGGAVWGKERHAGQLSERGGEDDIFDIIIFPPAGHTHLGHVPRRGQTRGALPVAGNRVGRPSRQFLILRTAAASPCSFLEQCREQVLPALLPAYDADAGKAHPSGVGRLYQGPSPVG